MNPRCVVGVVWLAVVGGLVGCGGEAAPPSDVAAAVDALPAPSSDVAAVDVGPAPAPVPWTPLIGATRQIVPGPGLDTGLPEAQAHNNLDVARHDGAVFLAVRVAAHHFADPAARIVVFRSVDEETWTREASFHLDTDVREPRLLAWNGTLTLYFAVLGRSRLAFDPQGMRVSRRAVDGSWSEPVPSHEPTFIPWRARVVSDAPWLIGYTGGGAIYVPGSAPMSIQVLTSRDGFDWQPAFGDEAVVLRGGGSETDAVVLSDGRLVAVVRNEAGDGGRYGSYLCTASAEARGDWRCRLDPRKFDSPLLFVHRGTPWLVARRQAANDGLYDLGRDDLDEAARHGFYEFMYWRSPKRCALWRVDPEAPGVEWVVDLPSAGDTCFPGVIALGDDAFAIYNYSSDIDGPDLDWNEGQNGLTRIYRTVVTFVPPAD